MIFIDNTTIRDNRYDVKRFLNIIKKTMMIINEC